MATAQAHAHGHHDGHAGKKYTGIMDWLTTVDHKKIGTLYLIFGTLFLAIAGLEAILFRVQLMFPMNDFLDGQTFNELITMHGTAMLFMAAMPILFGFMNWIVVLQIGARDVAFPFLNALGLWTFFFGAVLMHISWFFGEVPDAGWTNYVPLSSEQYSGHHGVDFYLMGLQLSGLGTLISGINFLATIITMRAPGMSFMRMPLFCWTTFIVSAMILFAFPALTVGLVLLTFDRLFMGNIFDPNMGGNIVLWEHIFWIFGHPEVYILMVPAFGIISEVLPVFSRKRLFGYSSMVFATTLIGFLGFMVWVHHMFATGLGPLANALFGIATMLIAVPTGIKVFNWLFTFWGGRIVFNTASLFAISFVPTFVMGGVTGVMLASPPADFQYHDTYFVVAHFHYIIVGGIILSIFSGVFYWFPKMTGRYLNETLGKIFFWLFTIGFHMTFLIQHFLGLLGMPRRVYTYLGEDVNPGWGWMNMVSSIGAFLMGFAVILLVINVIYTLTRPQTAKGDAWEDGRTLEWAISSPPPEYNFKQTPLVRGLDTWWKEKMEGKTEFTPAEPVGPIHMPNGSILPIIMSIGLFIFAFGLMYADELGGYIVALVGIAINFLCMFIRSLKDDPGYHIDPADEKGVQA